jgi:hypothetical protein
MGIAHGRGDILMAEQFLDFPQILFHVIEQNCRRGMPQPLRGDLPYPEGSTGGPQPQIERPVGKRRASCMRHVQQKGVGESVHYRYSKKWNMRSPERRIFGGEPVEYYDGEE